MIRTSRLPFIVAALLLLFALVSITPVNAADQKPIRVVAAESSYGSIAETIGGSHVEVISVIDSPSVDPHAYEPTPAVARQLAGADLVVMNGLGYDGWMNKLLQASPAGDREMIDAGKVASNLVLPDKNPHLFYSPRAMLITASYIAQALSSLDAAHSSDYAAGLDRFREQLLPIYAEVQKLIAAHPQLTVTATEPVFGYMFNLLGYRNLYNDMQIAAMNDAEPDAKDMKEFAQGLENHVVQLLVYNDQVHDRLTESLINMAKKAGVPTVGVSEIPLHGEDYAQWQIKQLQRVLQVLDRSQ